MLDNMASLSSNAIFRTSVVLLSQSNEMFGCFNPWVITPGVTNNGPKTWFSLDPIVITIAYAILEPLASRDLQRLELPPWTLLLGIAPFHMIWSLTSMDAYNMLSGVPQRSRDTAWELDKSSRFESPPRNRSFLEQIFIALTFVLPVITSTVLNATFLLFSHSLFASSLLGQPGSLILTWAAAFAFLTSRFGDYVICKQARRGRSIGTAVICQMILFAVRAYTRSLLGLAVFSAFQIPGLDEAEQKFGSQRYEWKTEFLPRVPALATWWWVLTFTGGSMMLVGRHFILRGIKEQAQAR